MKLNKQEIRDLKKHGYDINLGLEKPNEQIITDLVVISNGVKEIHDSGYPYIRIIGKSDKGKLVELGWHDHFVCNVFVNIDSFGKNIFHVMNWCKNNKKWKIRKDFMYCSSFLIGDFVNKKEEYINLS